VTADLDAEWCVEAGLAGADWRAVAAASAAALVAADGGPVDAADGVGGLAARVAALAASPGLVRAREGGEEDGSVGDAVVAVWADGSGRPADGATTPAATWSPVIDGDAPPERVSVADGKGGRVAGVRRRLLPPAAPPLLPPAGRLAVAAGPRRAGAVFTLPSASDPAGVDALPAAVWVSAGSLAADGVALQLRLVRDGAPGGGGRGRGVIGVGGASGWACYRVAGGALTTAVER
jgi:hypothetical protein